MDLAQKGVQLDYTEQFVREICSLGRGDQAVLRRTVGRPISEASARAHAIFFRSLLGRPRQNEEEILFAVAGWICLWREISPSSISFADSVRLLRSKGESEIKSFDKLMSHILDLPLDGDGYLLDKIGRIMRRLSNDGLSLDFARLAKDLRYWNSDNQSVQLRWAREYYGRKLTDVDVTLVDGDSPDENDEEGELQ